MQQSQAPAPGQANKKYKSSYDVYFTVQMRFMEKGMKTQEELNSEILNNWTKEPQEQKKRYKNFFSSYNKGIFSKATLDQKLEANQKPLMPITPFQQYYVGNREQFVQNNPYGYKIQIEQGFNNMEENAKKDADKNYQSEKQKHLNQFGDWLKKQQDDQENELGFL